MRDHAHVREAGRPRRRRHGCHLVTSSGAHRKGPHTPLRHACPVRLPASRIVRGTLAASAVRTPVGRRGGSDSSGRGKQHGGRPAQPPGRLSQTPSPRPPIPLAAGTANASQELPYGRMERFHDHGSHTVASGHQRPLKPLDQRIPRLQRCFDPGSNFVQQAPPAWMPLPWQLSMKRRPPNQGFPLALDGRAVSRWPPVVPPSSCRAFRPRPERSLPCCPGS